MKKALTILTTLMLGAALSASASLSIVNAGFEDPITGTYTSGGVINGWDPIVGSGGGVWNINNFPAGFWTVPAPESDQVGWLSSAPDGGPTTVAQTVTSTAVAGYTYVFSGYVGHPIGYGDSQNPDTQYTVAIMAGNVIVASLSGTGPEGSFIPFSVSWTALAGDAGKSLGVELGTSQAQTAFDALSLAAVPEATTIIAGALLLLPLGASTLRILHRKRTV